MPVFIPEPKKIRQSRGVFTLPRKPSIGIADQSLTAAAEQVRETLRGGDIAVAVEGVDDPVRILYADDCDPGGYRLRVGANGVLIEAADADAARHAAATLDQLAAQSPKGELQNITIEDAPDFADRGVYYDVCRGRVPELDRLKEQIELLSRYKINHIQLYVEHTFRFRLHPSIGKNASPLSAEDVLTLDAFCADRGIELVPSLASFGHLATVLNDPKYRHLAEDWGEGRYVDPEADKHRTIKGWSLAPANEEIYVFLDQLFSEFLPCFRSERFNVCCDETWDMGLGQSYELAQKVGKYRMYLDHLLRLRELAAAYGKKLMFWGDIIRKAPELIPEIPDDVTVLDWGYSAEMDFDRIKDFTATGLPSFVCPSVCGYVTLFPRIHESADNIAGWAEAGVEHGAVGLLNTDWGDGGHYNFMECAWPGYLYGAEQAWNAKADRKSFWERFCTLFLDIDDGDFVSALVELGDIAQLGVGGFYQSAWRHVFFGAPGDPIFEPTRRDASVSTRGKIKHTKIILDAKLGRETAKRLERIRKIFANHAKRKKNDPHKALPYWLLSVDMLLHAAKKLAVVGKGGRDTKDARKKLRAEMRSLRKQFEKMWMARNRKSEIRTTLNYFDHAIEGL